MSQATTVGEGDFHPPSLGGYLAPPHQPLMGRRRGGRNSPRLCPGPTRLPEGTQLSVGLLHDSRNSGPAGGGGYYAAGYYATT